MYAPAGAKPSGTALFAYLPLMVTPRDPVNHARRQGVKVSTGGRAEVSRAFEGSKMATMYTRKSRLTSRQQHRLIEHFVAGSTARAASEVVGVQPNTSIRFFLRPRPLITSKIRSYRLCGEVEAYESYFGGKCKGKRGRGVAGKVAGIGLLKRGGHVYTAIIPNARMKTLLPIIQEKVAPDSIVYTDTFRAYNALDVSDFRHRRINHSKLFADNHNHINRCLSGHGT